MQEYKEVIKDFHEKVPHPTPSQRLAEAFLEPGFFEKCDALKARRELITACQDWRPPWVSWWDPSYRHPPGWPEEYVDRRPVPPVTDKAKPVQWEVDRADRVARALKQHLQGVREDAGAGDKKSEVKNELEVISQVSQEPLKVLLEKELDKFLEVGASENTVSASVAWDPYQDGGGKHHSEL